MSPLVAGERRGDFHNAIKHALSPQQTQTDVWLAGYLSTVEGRYVSPVWVVYTDSSLLYIVIMSAAAATPPWLPLSSSSPSQTGLQVEANRVY